MKAFRVIKLLLATAIISIFISILPLSSWGQGLTSISISPTIGPYKKTQQFVSDVSYALRLGLPSYGMFTAIPSGSSLNISNAFNTGTNGQTIYYTLAVTSSVPFTLSQISLNSIDVTSTLSGTFGQFGFSYSNMGIGLGTNGTIYTSGNADSPVYAVYIAGLGRTFATSGSLSNSLAASAFFCPLTTIVTYSLNNTTNSAQIIFFDPAITMNIMPTGSNILILSWTVSQFDNLQQNTDLTTTNWVSMTNTLSENAAGTQYQTIVTNTGTRFFRLKYP